MTRHPSAEHLAEFVEGVLSRRWTAKVSSHLDTGCIRCHGQVVQLKQVTSVLTSASLKFGPMPDQFSARIEMAIASESSARVTSAQASARPAAGTSLRVVSSAASTSGGEAGASPSSPPRWRARSRP